MTQTLRKLLEEAERGGYLPYAFTSDYSKAVAVRDDRREFHPESSPSIGLLHDGTWIVWTKSLTP